MSDQPTDDEDAWTGSLIPPEVLAAIRQAEAESDATIAAIARLDAGPPCIPDHSVAVHCPGCAHDAGPTVAEAAANDRRWPLEKEGE